MDAVVALERAGDDASRHIMGAGDEFMPVRGEYASVVERARAELFTREVFEQVAGGPISRLAPAQRLLFVQELLGVLAANEVYSPAAREFSSAAANAGEKVFGELSVLQAMPSGGNDALDPTYIRPQHALQVAARLGSTGRALADEAFGLIKDAGWRASAVLLTSDDATEKSGSPYGAVVSKAAFGLGLDETKVADLLLAQEVLAIVADETHKTFESEWFKEQAGRVADKLAEIPSVGLTRADGRESLF